VLIVVGVSTDKVSIRRLEPLPKVRVFVLLISVLRHNLGRPDVAVLGAHDVEVAMG